MRPRQKRQVRSRGTSARLPGGAAGVQTSGDGAVADVRLAIPRRRTVALLGPPNSGKTTLFNTLTGRSMHVGNWPGKTVERAEGRVSLPTGEATLVDLPGLYALSGGSVEEEVAWGFLVEDAPDAVVVVAEATRLRRGLRLWLQARELTPRLVLAVTMMDEAARMGLEVDLDALSKSIGAPVVGLVAPRGTGLTDLTAAIGRVVEHEIQPTRAPYPPQIEASLLEVERALDAEGVEGIPTRWLALRLLEGDLATMSWVTARDGGQAASLARRMATPFRGVLADRVARSLGSAAKRLALGAVGSKASAEGGEVGRFAWDRVILHPLLAVPFVALLFGALFWVTLVAATPLSAILATAFDALANGIRAAMAGAPPWFAKPLVEGLVYGVGAVVAVMLPTMAIFFVLFALLEDSGLVPRVAFTMDRVMRMAGGQGKQCLTCMMAYGCNIPGILSTRIMSGRDRLVAILVNALNPCNGRLGGMVVLAALFFGGRAWLVMAGLIALSWLAVFLAIALLTRVLRAESATPFVIELPPYRMPDWGRVIGRTLRTKVLAVLWRAAVVAAPFSLAIWYMSNLPAGDPFAGTYTGRMVTALQPLASPLGLDGGMLAALVFSLPAKEIMVASLAVTYGQAADLAGGFALLAGTGAGGLGSLLLAQWSPLTVFCFLLFYMLYLPCSYTTITIWKETRSWRLTALSQAVPLAFAALFTFGAYRLGLAAGLG